MTWKCVPCRMMDSIRVCIFSLFVVLLWVLCLLFDTRFFFIVLNVLLVCGLLVFMHPSVVSSTICFLYLEWVLLLQQTIDVNLIRTSSVDWYIYFLHIDWNYILKNPQIQRNEGGKNLLHQDRRLHRAEKVHYIRDLQSSGNIKQLSAGNPASCPAQRSHVVSRRSTLDKQSFLSSKLLVLAMQL